jgi:hypothetical protein
MKTLLAIDGSKFSDAAAQTMLARARPQDEVYVLHVAQELATLW